MMPSPSPDHRKATAPPRLQWSVWGQWILANTIGEAIGLSATLVAGVLLFARLEPTVGPVVSAILGVVMGASIEGGVVGTAQWIVLRRPLSGLQWTSWVEATALGAGLAWALGLIPSTIASLGTSGADSGGTSVQDISGPLWYGLAAALGFVAGSILAVAQWWVLRRFVPQARWWVLANACAWSLEPVMNYTSGRGRMQYEYTQALPFRCARRRMGVCRPLSDGVERGRLAAQARPA